MHHTDIRRSVYTCIVHYKCPFCFLTRQFSRGNPLCLGYGYGCVRVCMQGPASEEHSRYVSLERVHVTFVSYYKEQKLSGQAHTDTVLESCYRWYNVPYNCRGQVWENHKCVIPKRCNTLSTQLL